MPFDGKSLTPHDLMSTPHHMRAWLESKSPDEIVARSMFRPGQCLGATFLREQGFAGATWGWVSGFAGGHHDRVTGCPVITATIGALLMVSPFQPITAARALAVLDVAEACEPLHKSLTPADLMAITAARALAVLDVAEAQS